MGLKRIKIQNLFFGVACPRTPSLEGCAMAAVTEKRSPFSLDPRQYNAKIPLFN